MYSPQLQIGSSAACYESLCMQMETPCLADSLRESYSVSCNTWAADAPGLVLGGFLKESNFKIVSNDFFVFVILSKECRLGIGELKWKRMASPKTNFLRSQPHEQGWHEKKRTRAVWKYAVSEDRTHDLWIMRPTRDQLLDHRLYSISVLTIYDCLHWHVMQHT